MTEHRCGLDWKPGTVDICPDHTHRGQHAVDVRPFDDERTRSRTEGVAATGQISPKGTVTHIDYWSGRLAAIARPATVVVKLRDQAWFRDRYVYRDGRWVDPDGRAFTWDFLTQPRQIGA